MINTTIRPDGTHEATKVYIDPVTGEKKRKHFYGKSQKEVDANYIDFMKKLDGQLEVNQKGMTVSEWLDKWWLSYQPSLEVSTRVTYASPIRAIKNADIGKYLIKEVRSTDIQNFVNTEEGKSEATINRLCVILRQAFSTAFNDRLIPFNPCLNIKKPKFTPRVKHKFISKEIQDLINSTWREHRFGPTAMLMVHAGLRRGEGMAFDCDKHIDWDRYVVKIEQTWKTTPDNSNVGTFGLPKDNSIGESLIDKELEEVLRGRHGYIFTKNDGTRCTVGAFKTAFNSYMRFLETRLNGIPKCTVLAAIKNAKKFGLKDEAMEQILQNWRSVDLKSHDARVTFTTNAFEKGLSIPTIRKCLRQRSGEVIYDAYLQQSSEAEKEDVSKYTGRPTVSLKSEGT